MQGLAGYSALYCDVMILKRQGDEHPISGQTPRKKPGADGKFVWTRLSCAAATERHVQQGVLVVRVIESRMVGGDKLVGTCTVTLKECARHEDEELGDGGKWYKLLAAEESGGARENGKRRAKAEMIGSCLLHVLIRSPQSGMEMMRQARRHINARQFDEAVPALHKSITQFRAKGNSMMLRLARDMIQEVERRRSLCDPCTLRRLSWLREQVWGTSTISSLAGQQQSHAHAQEGLVPVTPAHTASHLLASPSDDVVVSSPLSRSSLSPVKAERLGPAVAKTPKSPENTGLLAFLGVASTAASFAQCSGKSTAAIDISGDDEVMYEQALEKFSEFSANAERLAAHSKRPATSLTEEVESAIQALPEEVQGALHGVTAAMFSSLQPSLAAAAQPAAAQDPLQTELLLQRAARTDHTARFVGREDLLQELAQYALDKPTQGAEVLLVEGAGCGVGVSALMAAFADATEKLMHERMPGGKLIYRAAGKRMCSCAQLTHEGCLS